MVKIYIEIIGLSGASISRISSVRHVQLLAQLAPKTVEILRLNHMLITTYFWVSKFTQIRAKFYARQTLHNLINLELGIMMDRISKRKDLLSYLLLSLQSTIF